MALAALAASNTVTAAQVSSEGVAILDTGRGQESSRILRTSDTKTADDDSSDEVVEEETSPKFIEHKLQNALSNPKKTNKLYQSWYKKGITAKEVASSLGQTENREISATYKTLAKGYAKYLKTQPSQ
jgi:hypothetical protein